MSSLSGLVLFFFSLSRLVSESFQERTFDFASLCWFCVLGILFCQFFFLSCVFFAPEDCLKILPLSGPFFFLRPDLCRKIFGSELLILRPCACFVFGCIVLPMFLPC